MFWVNADAGTTVLSCLIMLAIGFAVAFFVVLLMYLKNNKHRRVYSLKRDGAEYDFKNFHVDECYKDAAAQGGIDGEGSMEKFHKL